MMSSSIIYHTEKTECICNIPKGRINTDIIAVGVKNGIPIRYTDFAPPCLGS